MQLYPLAYAHELQCHCHQKWATGYEVSMETLSNRGDPQKLNFEYHFVMVKISLISG